MPAQTRKGKVVLGVVDKARREELPGPWLEFCRERGPGLVAEVLVEEVLRPWPKRAQWSRASRP
eukprot:14672608-Alexandrium_andersonii.AAC.1